MWKSLSFKTRDVVGHRAHLIDDKLFSRSVWADNGNPSISIFESSFESCCQWTAITRQRSWFFQYIAHAICNAQIFHLFPFAFSVVLWPHSEQHYAATMSYLLLSIDATLFPLTTLSLWCSVVHIFAHFLNLFLFGFFMSIPSHYILN